MTEARDKILEVTVRIFAEAGYHGTTTRRIAQEAGVNEVTLFRHFGSKEALLHAALAQAHRDIIAPFPADRADPQEALVEWALDFHGRLCERRQLIRRLLGEVVERPQLAANPCEGADDEMQHVAGFLDGMRAAGVLGADADCSMGAHVLVSALFSDAIWRDLMPTPVEAEAFVRATVRFVLQGLGYRAPAGVTA